MGFTGFAALGKLLCTFCCAWTSLALRRLSESTEPCWFGSATAPVADCSLGTANMSLLCRGMWRWQSTRCIGSLEPQVVGQAGFWFRVILWILVDPCSLYLHLVHVSARKIPQLAIFQENWGVSIHRGPLKRQEAFRTRSTDRRSQPRHGNLRRLVQRSAARQA